MNSPVDKWLPKWVPVASSVARANLYDFLRIALCRCHRKCLNLACAGREKHVNSRKFYRLTYLVSRPHWVSIGILFGARCGSPLQRQIQEGSSNSSPLIDSVYAIRDVRSCCDTRTRKLRQGNYRMHRPNLPNSARSLVLAMVHFSRHRSFSYRPANKHDWILVALT